MLTTFLFVGFFCAYSCLTHRKNRTPIAPAPEATPETPHMPEATPETPVIPDPWTLPMDETSRTPQPRSQENPPRIFALPSAGPSPQELDKRYTLKQLQKLAKGRLTGISRKKKAELAEMLAPCLSWRDLAA